MVDQLIARLVALILSVMMPLLPVREPHHDDTLHVRMPVGEWDAVRGFQHLDEGRVTFVGEPCAHLHLAGHHSSHGAPFARLTDIKAGDTIEVWSPSVACTYRVDRVEAYYSPYEPPYGDLLMQTSLPGGFFLVFGTKV